MTLASGLVILQPDAVIAVGPHDTATALYAPGGAIVVPDSVDAVVATLTGDKKALAAAEEADTAQGKAA
jgi:hypothetical protein